MTVSTWYPRKKKAAPMLKFRHGGFFRQLMLAYRDVAATLSLFGLHIQTDAVSGLFLCGTGFSALAVCQPIRCPLIQGHSVCFRPHGKFRVQFRRNTKHHLA